MTKLNPSGSNLSYSTSFGAPGLSAVGGLVLDSSGNPIVVGNTTTFLFPTTSGVVQLKNPDPISPTLYRGSGFIAKFDLSSSVICSLSLSVNSISVPVAGATGTVSVFANPGCPWVAVVSDVEFPSGSLSLSSANGVGNGSFTYTVSSGSQATSDSAADIHVGSSIVHVTQPAGACSAPTFSSTSRVFPASASMGIISVQIPSGCRYAAATNVPWISFTATGYSTSTNVIFYLSANGSSDRNGTITILGNTFYIAQFGSASLAGGHTSVGVMQPLTRSWQLDSNGSGVYDGGDRFFPFFTLPGDIAVVGDWTGDGHAKVGVYRNGFWLLDMNNNGIWDGPTVDRLIALGGQPGDIPFVGDWNGDGRAKVGVYSRGFWLLDTNGDGVFNGSDQLVGFGGNIGEQPVVGDWNGDGRTKVGFLYAGTWQLDYNGNGVFDSADKVYSFLYLPGDKAVVGDWNGSHTTKIGIYRAGFWLLDYNGNGVWDGPYAGDRLSGFGGNPGEIPVVGDWNGSGTTKIGYYYKGFWQLDYNGNGVFDGLGAGQDRFIGFGGTLNEQPVVGAW